MAEAMTRQEFVIKNIQNVTLEEEKFRHGENQEVFLVIQDDTRDVVRIKLDTESAFTIVNTIHSHYDFHPKKG